MVHSRSRALALVIVVAALAATGLTGCKVAVAGRRCHTTELGQDRSHVLVCRSGRWTRAVTKQAAAKAVAELVARKQANAAIRQVDFQNITLPAGSCRLGSWLNPFPIPLSFGSGESGDPDGDGSQASVLSVDVVGFADVTGDGRDEAVLGVTCTGSSLETCCAGVLSTMLFGVVLAGSPDQLTLVGTPITPDEQFSPEASFEGLSLSGDTVVAQVRFPVADEPLCCREGLVTQSFRWNGSTWFRAS